MLRRSFFRCLWFFGLVFPFITGVARAETKAYWRFEGGAPGAAAAVGLVADSDETGANPLSVYADFTRPHYSGAVPTPAIPQTGAPNRSAASFGWSDDFFTRDTPLNTFDFGPRGSNAWTVELSVNLAAASGVNRLVGRDGVTPDVDYRGPLQIVTVGNQAGQFDVRAEIIDGSNVFRAAVSAPIYRAGQWLNIAATADATTLKLWIDTLDGRGYQECAQTPIRGALNATTGAFAVGRGFSRQPSERMGGLIDEVRISDEALAPAQFLFSTPDGQGVSAPPAPPDQPRPVALFKGADPHVDFYSGQFWMYITAQNNNGPGNPVLHAFSSPDLKTWTKSAQPIFQFNFAPWIAANGRANNSAWAPCIAEKDGRYYLYYSVGPQNDQGPARIGVAVGDAPDAVFVDSGQALVTGDGDVEAIDPMVFRDPRSGRAYLYAGGSARSRLRVWELAPDMVSLARQVPVQTPAQFTEAPFMHFANGLYYLSYSHGNYRDASYSVHYATSASPLGPWQYRGPILQSDATHKGPGHHAFVRDPRSGQWFIVYHRWQSANGGNPFERGRSIAIEPLHYDATGAIAPIHMGDEASIATLTTF